jgi:hypothetical protein
MFSSLFILTIWQTMEVSKDTLITNTDRTENVNSGKIFFFQKRHYNCEKLNTRSHAKFPAVFLKNAYYTPCNTAHVITPPCNTDQANYYTSWRYDLLHFDTCKIKHILSKYMIIRTTILWHCTVILNLIEKNVNHLLDKKWFAMSILHMSWNHSK